MSKGLLADAPVRSKSWFKPGGTGHLVHGRLLGRFVQQAADKWGRWTKLTLLGRQRKLVIYAAYQSPIQSASQGHFTFHQQQLTAIKSQKAKDNIKEETKDSETRQKFQEDIIADISKYSLADHDLIIMADFNETDATPESIIAQLAGQCQLTDVWKHCKPNKTNMATYERGHNRIDFCLVSTNLLPYITDIQMTNFREIANSDHRGLVLNIKESFFTNKRVTSEFLDRTLLSNDASQVRKYLYKLHSLLQDQNVFQRTEKLCSSDRFEKEQLEKLDKAITEACLTAENHLKRRRRPWWSKKLNKLRIKARILKTHLSCLKQGFKASVHLQWKCDNNDLNLTLPRNIKDTQTLLTEAKEALKEGILRARELREEEQLMRLEVTRRTGEPDKAKIQKIIYQNERLAQAFRTVKSIRKQQDNQQLNKLEIPSQWLSLEQPTPDALDDPKHTTQWTTITDQDDINKFLLLRNKKHFNQSSGTPLTSNKWTQLLDWAATSEVARSITEGIFPLNDLPLAHQAVLQACKKETEEPLVDFHLSPDAFRGKLKGWRESTSTSPSGRHLGHYKALVARRNLFDPEERDEIESMQDDIIQLLVSIINYTTKHRYSLSRWHRIESTIIPKDKGSVKIHRMRVIHIFEADYNLLLGVKWREVILQLEDTGYLHPDQHGSRPGHEARVLPLQEELCYDIARCSKTILLNFDNDATACYDRVVAELASLAGIKHGQHPNLIAVNTRTLQEARYYIRSRTSSSNKFYQHSTEYPTYGTGQGCANSPTVWCTISSVLFKAHETASHGASFCTPSKEESVDFSMVGFVDDSTGRVNCFEQRPQPTVEQMTATMQEDAQLWNDMLWFSGGKLELAKCSYHLLAWDFDEYGAAFPIEHPNLPKIELHAANNERIPVKRKSVFMTHKTLGHYKAPCGEAVLQLAKIKDKARNAAVSLTKSKLPADLIWTMYNAVYLPSVAYALPQSRFDPEVLDEAQSESMRQIFAHCGFNRNTSCKILYGPSYLGGAGFIPWSTLQGEGQLLQFLQHWRSNTKTSTLLRISLSWAQYQAGTATSILSNVDTPLPYVEAKWIMSIRQTLASMDGSLELDNTYCYPAQRRGGQSLMDIALSFGDFNFQELKLINTCRLHLQVTNVSDITNLAGNMFQPGAYTGQKELLISTPKELQSIQPKPHYKAWRQWIRLLNKIGNQSGGLHQPLGSWLFPANKLKRRWCSYHNTRMDEFHRFQPRTHLWETLQLIDGHFQVIATQPHWTPSKYDVPSFIQEPSPQIEPPDTPIATFEEFLQVSETYGLIKNLEVKDDPYTLMAKLNEHPGSTFGVSDGSSMPTSMSQGWTVATKQHGCLVEGAGPAFGNPSSFRAESYGVLTIILFLEALQKFTSTKLHRITICCDNASLIRKLNTLSKYKNWFPNQFLTTDADVIYKIVMRSKNFSNMSFKHVKGHQDDVSHDLSFEAQLNVRADFLAGRYIANHPGSIGRAPLLNNTKAQLHARGRSITSNYRYNIRNALHGASYCQYLCEAHGWGDEEYSNINWQHFAALNHKTRHLRIWKTKFMNDLLPTVHTNQTYSYNRPCCPFCSQKTDTWQHTVVCPQTERRNRMKNVLRRLAWHMCEHDTAPHIYTAIMTGLKNWLHGNTLPDIFCSEVHAGQNRIGWWQFLKGFWHKGWAEAQHRYLCDHNLVSLHSTGSLWAQKLQHYLLVQMHTLWKQHTASVHRPMDGPTAAHTRLCRQIQQIQLDHRQECPSDDHRFHLSSEQLESSTETKLRNWLALYGPLVKLQCRLHRHARSINQTMITDFFRSPGVT